MPLYQPPDAPLSACSYWCTADRNTCPGEPHPATPVTGERRPVAHRHRQAAAVKDRDAPDQRTKEGKSNIEATRCLKRYVAGDLT